MLSRSLQSVGRPARGFICLSCLVKQIDNPVRVARAYRHDVAADNANSGSIHSEHFTSIGTPKNILISSNNGNKDSNSEVSGFDVDSESPSGKKSKKKKKKAAQEQVAQEPAEPKPPVKSAKQKKNERALKRRTSEKRAPAIGATKGENGSPVEEPRPSAATEETPSPALGKKSKRTKALAKKKRTIEQRKLEKRARAIGATKEGDGPPVAQPSPSPAAKEASLAKKERKIRRKMPGKRTVLGLRKARNGSVVRKVGLSDNWPGDAPEKDKRNFDTENVGFEFLELVRESAAGTANKFETTLENDGPPGRSVGRGNLEPVDGTVTPLPETTGAVPKLSYGLDRVLFNPGVYHLQDPRTHVYNFDPYLGKLMPVTEFDFDALNEYITSSRDQVLREIAVKHGKKYIGSSSSMTSVLSQFHFLLSSWRSIHTSTLSQGFTDKLRTFTKLTRAPAAVFLRYKDGVYAIDADKEFDSANILMNLGKSMEKLLTMSTDEFERYRRSSGDKVDPETVAPEAYHYSTSGDFLMRAQLDAYDPRLPGTGMFDLKTRAVVSIRMDAKNYEGGQGYQIKSRFGNFESFEREFFDMIRSAFLKYSLQVRIGRMDGIFVAFHNTERIFGFQYLPLSELDQTLHGQEDTTLGDKEFELSIALWNKILQKATAQFPEQSLRFHFETRESTSDPFMYIFAEPMTEDEIDKIQTKNRHIVEEYQRKLLHPELYDNETQAEKQVSENKTTEDKAEAAEAASADNDSSETSAESNSESNPESYDSKSEADVAFLESLNKDQELPQPGRELFAITLLIRNKVNGDYVQRPENLSPADKWSVEYQFNQFSSPERAWTVYQACQKRRMKELSEREPGPEEDSNNPYWVKLRQLSASGREWREEMDRAEIEKGTIVLKE